MLLGAYDGLPPGSRRILVHGCSGAGKSTLARSLSGRLGIPYTEIDALFHGPDWTPRPSFVEDVRALAETESWVTEWQYPQVRPLLLARCDLMVWLDLPRSLVMRRVVRRTVVRRLRRTELWNGNREGPLRHVFTDPEHIFRWAWDTYPLVAQRAEAAQRERPELPVLRLRSPKEVDRWLQRLSGAAGTPGPPR